MPGGLPGIFVLLFCTLTVSMIDFILLCMQDALIILPMRTVDQEGIPISATDKAPVRLNAFLQPTTDAAQDIIAVIPAVLFIDQVEMADIHLDAIHLQFLVEYVELIGVVEKEVLIVQPRELIALHGTDNALVI